MAVVRPSPVCHLCQLGREYVSTRVAHFRLENWAKVVVVGVAAVAAVGSGEHRARATCLWRKLLGPNQQVGESFWRRLLVVLCVTCL